MRHYTPHHHSLTSWINEKLCQNDLFQLVIMNTRLYKTAFQYHNGVMGVTTVLLTIILLGNALCFAQTCNINIRQEIYETGKYNNEVFHQNNEIFSDGGKSLCAMRCLQGPACKSFSYSEAEASCELITASQSGVNIRSADQKTYLSEHSIDSGKVG